MFAKIQAGSSSSLQPSMQSEFTSQTMKFFFVSSKTRSIYRTEYLFFAVFHYVSRLHVCIEFNQERNITSVLILNTISKRQDGSDLFRILHTKSFSKFTEALCTRHGMCITWYNIPLFSLIQMLKLVLHILNLK